MLESIISLPSLETWSEENDKGEKQNETTMPCFKILPSSLARFSSTPGNISVAGTSRKAR